MKLRKSLILILFTQICFNKIVFIYQSTSINNFGYYVSQAYSTTIEDFMKNAGVSSIIRRLLTAQM